MACRSSFASSASVRPRRLSEHPGRQPSGHQGRHPYARCATAGWAALWCSSSLRTGFRTAPNLPTSAEDTGDGEPRRYPSTIGGAFYIAVLAVIAISIGVITTGSWRLGIRWFGGALLFISVVEHIVLAVVPPMSLATSLEYRGRQVLPLAVTKGAHEVWVDVLHLIAVDVPPDGRAARVIDGYSGPIAAARVN